MELKIEYMRTEELRPYAGNAKMHPAEQVEQIKRSIEEFGFNDPIAIWRGNEIIEGHGRLIAAEELGMQEVPVIRLDGLTDEQRRAYALVHNKTTMNSDFDLDLLQAELNELTDIDMAQFGFDDAAADDQTEDVSEDDYDPEIPEEPRAKTGDVYQLGEHRLMCGDSTDPEALRILMNGAKGNLVVTDPPYGVAIGDKMKLLNEADPGKGGIVAKNIENDTIPHDQLREILTAAFANVKTFCEEDCSYYVSSAQGGELGQMMLEMMRDAGLPVRHNLIWVKSSPVFSMGRLDYDYRHEPIFYTWAKKHNFYGGAENSVIDDSLPLEKMSKTELKDLVHELRGDNRTSVIYCDKPHKSELHPTMKPVKLFGRFIINSSQRGDAGVDIFGGSGTTIIACEQLGRRCYTMEKDPHYVDVIIDRWEKFTGEKARLVNE